MDQELRDAFEEFLENFADGLAFICKAKDNFKSAIDQYDARQVKIKNSQVLIFQTKQQFEAMGKAVKRQLELMHPKYDQEA